MKRKTIYTCLFVMIMFSLQAQNDKLRIAIFDPISLGASIDEGIKVAVREIISSVFVNTDNYTIVERSLIERVMQEQKFSNSGAVEDSQASEIGRLAGANKIVLSVVTLTGERNMLSIKLVDVLTANVERQKTQIIATNELLNAVEPLALQLMGEETSLEQQTQIATNTNIQQIEREIPEPDFTISSTIQIPALTSMEQLTAQGRNVFLSGRNLSIDEAQQRLKINSEALQLYQKGKSKYNTGNTLIIAGGVFLVAGVICSNVSKTNNDFYDYYDNHGGHHYGNSISTEYPLAIVGTALAVAGLTTGIIGFVSKRSGKKHIQEAINNYNRNNKSNIEFSFCYMQNGLGLAIIF